MRQQLLVPAALLSFFAACADLPSESTSVAEVRTSNRISANRISANRISANRISANRISANRLGDGRLSVNLETTQELLATPDGRELFSLIVSCALPQDVTLVATVDGTQFEFFGEIGLARHWLHSRLNREGQGWVTACMLARVNANELAIPISMRGTHRELVALEDERAAWTLEEGAFFGNVFGDVDEPLQWYACRGKDQAASELGDLASRDCTEPDPANPGLTQCGFNFAGDCGDFVEEPACESFSESGTFYRRCHTSPIRHHRHHDQDCERDHVFRQVITTFVLP